MGQISIILLPPPISSLELFGDQGKDTKPFAYFKKDDDDEEEEDGSCGFSRKKIFASSYHTMSCCRHDGSLRMWYSQISVDHHPHDDDDGGGGSGESFVESDENDDESYVYVGDEDVQSLPEEQEW